MPVPYNSMHTIDINCDLGEGFNNDNKIMPFISSANIACGYHAGDLTTMQKTVALCVEHGVAIGAHPGFNDKVNFGRKNMYILLPDNMTEPILKSLKKPIYSANKIMEGFSTTGILNKIKKL